MLAFSEDAEQMHFLAAAILIAAGSGWIAFALYRRANPGSPVLELSPGGIRFLIPGLKEIRIPWREVSAIERMGGSSFFSRLVHPRLPRRGVTAIRVSRAFYDRQIHVASPFMRGPGWNRMFFPGEKTARIALHHEALSVPADELHRAVEERWKAFRPRRSVLDERETPGTPTAEAEPARHRVDATRSSGLSLGQAWYAAKIVVLLAGIAAMLANIMGYWQTGSQRQARAEHDYWQSQYDKWDAEEKRSAEERRKKDQEWEEFWKKQRF
jgi:hypothetical protein